MQREISCLQTVFSSVFKDGEARRHAVHQKTQRS